MIETVDRKGRGAPGVLATLVAGLATGTSGVAFRVVLALVTLATGAALAAALGLPPSARAGRWPATKARY